MLGLAETLLVYVVDVVLLLCCLCIFCLFVLSLDFWVCSGGFGFNAVVCLFVLLLVVLDFGLILF